MSSVFTPVSFPSCAAPVCTHRVSLHQNGVSVCDSDTVGGRTRLTEANSHVTRPGGSTSALSMQADGDKETDNTDVCSSLLLSITNNQSAGGSTDQYVFNGGGWRQQTEPDWICVQLVRVVLVVASSRGALEVLGALLLPAPVKAPFSTVGQKTAERRGAALRNDWTSSYNKRPV